MKIISLLEAVDKPIGMKDFIAMCAKEGLFAELRRASYLFVTLLREHNEKFYS